MATATSTGAPLMRIHVVDAGAEPGSQIRAYAEYRVFSRLAPLSRSVRLVKVMVSRATDGTTACAVHADLGPAGQVQARSRRAQPLLAIDSAAEKLADAARRRLASTIGP
jgi:ribosome-associated translation inhibitor RaiA